jgi:hypothetical protein
MHVRPARGSHGNPLLIRDPRTRAHLPQEGAKVPEDTYWLRRLKKGDIEVFVPDAGKSKSAKEE